MTTAIALMALAAFLIGFAKTSIGGVATVAVAIFAWVLPARESTAAVLLVLIIGDLVAVWHYRRDCDWSLLRQLVPSVLPGLLLGTAFLAVVSDSALRVVIGVIILVLVAIQLAIRRRDDGGRMRASRAVALGTGLAAGFTTMTANAGGAVMTLYLVAQGVAKRRFIGTAAWFFFGVNLCKLPFSVGLGLLHLDALVRAAALAPAVLLGTWVGVHTVSRMRQSHFDLAVLGASALSGLLLVVST